MTVWISIYLLPREPSSPPPPPAPLQRKQKCALCGVYNMAIFLPFQALDGFDSQCWGHRMFIALIMWRPVEYRLVITRSPGTQASFTDTHDLGANRIGCVFSVHSPPQGPGFDASCPPYSTFPGGASGKDPTSQCRRHEMPFQSPGQEDPLKKRMATHSRILARRISWTEEPGRLQSLGWPRVKQDWRDLAPRTCSLFTVLRCGFDSISPLSCEFPLWHTAPSTSIC